MLNSTDRPERWWYEGVIAIRKLAVVMIATFGQTFMGRADLQAFSALAVVFVSIIVHLTVRPFDTSDRDHAMLHLLEFLSLCMCWFTFWGGKYEYSTL